MEDVARGNVKLEHTLFGDYIVGREMADKCDLGSDYETARENAVNVVKCLIKGFEIKLEDLV